MNRIELLLSAGMSLDRLADKFSLHRQALHRHWKKHVSAEKKAAFALGPAQMQDLCETVAEEGGSRLDYLKLGRRYCMDALQREHANGNTMAMTRAASVLREFLDDIGRLQGEVLKWSPSNVTVNQTFFNDPRFSLMQAGLMAIGRDHPSVLPAMIELMERLDGAGMDKSATVSDLPPLIEGRAA